MLHAAQKPLTRAEMGACKLALIHMPPIVEKNPESGSGEFSEWAGRT